MKNMIRILCTLFCAAMLAFAAPMNAPASADVPGELSLHDDATTRQHNWCWRRLAQPFRLRAQRFGELAVAVAKAVRAA
jgi:hypothetical protein